MLRVLLLCLIPFAASFSYAATPIGSKHSTNRLESQSESKNEFVVPFLFSTESMGLNLGAGGAIQGYGQEQMTVGAAGWGGEESFGLSGGIFDLVLPFSSRTFFSVSGMYAYFPEQRAYAGGNLTPSPPDEPKPGGPDSSPDQYYQGAGFSNWLNIKIEYVLPLGDRKNDPTTHYTLRNGLLQNGPTSTTWNPLTTGSTTLAIRQLNRYQTYNVEGETLSGDMNAFAIGIQYDNTDFFTNPSMGSRQYLGYTYEGQWFTKDDNWDYVELDVSKYMSIGSSEWASQRIFAFNFWTAYSPSWDVAQLSDGNTIITDAPPYNTGASLGGYYRMRGYDSSRFHDKASIYTAAEYRYTLKHNPIKDIELLRFLNLDWFQLVGFIEAGQVASDYHLSKLTNNIKYDAGISLRALVGGLVVRSDFAVSEEGSYIWFMYNQPF
jgi:hypothetical protein